MRPARQGVHWRLVGAVAVQIIDCSIVRQIWSWAGITGRRIPFIASSSPPRAVRVDQVTDIAFPIGLRRFPRKAGLLYG
jgi:hypothetical protein